MTHAHPKEVVDRFYEQVLNQRNIALIDELAVEHFVEHVPFPGQGPGRQGLKEVVGMMLAAFPDLNWQIKEQVIQGEKVVSRFVWQGTHQGVFLGVAPTGRTVSVWGIVIDEVRHGQLAASRILMDIPGLMAQWQ